ncbi:hypothetical protein LB516_23930 [Mesorhizobium sp. CO1-1-7]|uniref:hypothetical protein n=1 Tax=unclassified Mesorhizobium TaxID=325217 RepID=UPI00112BBC3F|nr:MULTISPECIES: hypothetical protein [unclassified Mesorhizobium]MBZ9748285.1 hypothetical protein [Mesorhizobium sp. CO1-1-7]TPL67531.1 hypothetical protein FJ954_24705 [Mesorhizobium sp. B2-3-15]TPL99416.1 hypothetical protein FJ943_13090 [Mesorhizobium sp. B2-3-10]
MPNTHVPAASEAMPAVEGMHIITGRFSRRLVLAGLASLPALGAATAASTAIRIKDPLLDSIRAYRAGLAAFNASTPDDDDAADAYAAITYERPFAALEKWHEPAKTRSSAIEALKLIAEENRAFERSGIVDPLLTAALAYFEVQS